MIRRWSRKRSRRQGALNVLSRNTAPRRLAPEHAARFTTSAIEADSPSSDDRIGHEIAYLTISGSQEVAPSNNSVENKKMHSCICDDVYRDITSRSILIRQLVKFIHTTQQQKSYATGVSQSQERQLLLGKVQRNSKSFESVCIYAHNVSRSVSSYDVRQCGILIKALAMVWNGSRPHVKALAVVIRSVGTLSPAGKSP